ncbi:methionyl-tRNA formyltransferase [Wolbachia endosymbiont of Dirofilaria (Dirofilaria) immitis]|uniref:methionyl-tRNA formyltransferase n=1 Tax=Wolbachia endosymbiont of Dirofilaria (Dirofilaria) immitis TaxID=1812115 RepID=UPI00158DE687|nr:methionyl-tRNA formyltransferase [Wolbachia endosymbiont of Dirofilaria (Dirofilaria) immitis]QKX02153.1 methionyl-tRNA formyltransferase [Wolbachia endosymbiont of Dirofilaria (Dirofilaria) immitis]
MRVIFMGSPEFAVSTLNLLLKSKNEVVAIYTKAPKPSGRGQRLTKSPIHAVAEKNDIEVCAPTSLKSLVEQEKFKSFKPDVAVIVSYGLILPKEILNIPKYGCINIHPSLLPRWRGAAPIQHAILAGDRETGISIMQLSEGLDSGPILKQKKFVIEKDDNYKTLHDKLSILGSNLLMEVLNEIEKQVPLEQGDDNICYADKVEDYRIYANNACEIAYRKVKAFYPKAFVKIGNKRLKVLDADFEINLSLTSAQGEIINDNMHISLENGVLIPKVVQMEGRNPCKVADFVRGLKLNIVKKFIE